MSRTYDAIAAATLTTDSASVTFSSIPDNYTDLVLMANVRGTALAYPRVLMNGSGADLSRIGVTGSGSTTASARASDNYIVNTAYWNTSDFAFMTTTTILNYASTVTFKPMITTVGNASVAVELVVNSWRSASALTSVQYYASSGNMAAGSTFQLFGVRAES